MVVGYHHFRKPPYCSIHKKRLLESLSGQEIPENPQYLLGKQTGKRSMFHMLCLILKSMLHLESGSLESRSFEFVPLKKKKKATLTWNLLMTLVTEW